MRARPRLSETVPSPSEYTLRSCRITARLFSSKDSPENMNTVSDSRRYNTSLGLILFAIYLLLYLGFVLISAFAPETMETPVLAGLNLAIVYGFALIIGALVMALIYGAMCRVETTVASSDVTASDSPSETSGVENNPEQNDDGEQNNDAGGEVQA